MYIEENPLLPALLYPPREEENAHITLADTFQMALHQTSSFLTFCSSKPEGAVAADMTMVSLMSTGPLFFFFLLLNGVICLKRDISYVPQNRNTSLFFPSLCLLHIFVLRGTFVPLGSNFCVQSLTMRTLERKGNESTNDI